MMNIGSIIGSILRQNLYTGTAVNVEMTGVRVTKYNQLVRIVSVLSKSLKPLLTGYIKTSQNYIVWKLQPSEYITETRIFWQRCYTPKRMTSAVIKNSRIELCKSGILVQKKQLLSLYILLRDEIKTDGYVVAMIELLFFSRILTKIDRDTNSAVDNATWKMSAEWEKKILCLCMDGLSKPSFFI